MTIALTTAKEDRLATAKLRILQTTDLHGHVLAYDYYRDAPSRFKGLSRTATLIGHARETSAQSLLFDSGDFLQGSPLSDRLATSASKSGSPLPYHPVISAMNQLGYDAATLGNHDLDFGLTHLEDVLKLARFPIVSANLVLPGQLSELVVPYALLSRRVGPTNSPLKIGVTGCLPHDTLLGGPAVASGVRATPVKPAVGAAVKALKRAGADVIIVLAHCGLGSAAASDQSAETIGNSIATIADIDAVLGGHTHEVHPSAPIEGNSLQDGPALVMAGAWGMHLGQIDMTLTRTAGSRWRARSARIEALPVSLKSDAAPDVPECPEIIASTASAHAATRAAMGAPVGVTKRRIDSFYALVRNDAGLQLIAEAFAAHVKELLQGTKFAQVPILSAAAPYKTGDRAGAANYSLIPPGTVAKRDVSALYGHSDRLCALRLTGADVRIWLEQSASIYQQMREGGEDVPLLNSAYPGYLFDVIPQLTYEIDLKEPARFSATRALLHDGVGRIKNLSYCGTAVEDNDVFIAAVNSFRAYGTWPLSSETGSAPKLLFDSGQLCADVLQSYIKTASPLEALAKPSWQFSSIKGASAYFLTAPEAREHPAHGIEDLGLTLDGFAKMRLRFQ